MKINSHNEWDKLQEVVLGTADETAAVITWPSSDPIPEDVAEKARKLAQEACPKWFIDEVNEDLDGIRQVFEQFGVKVFRPQVHKINEMFSSPYDWSSTGNNIYNIRDLHLIVGNNVIESASPVKGRYYEATGLYDVWYHYFEEGFRWLVAPKPRLEGEILSPYYRDDNEAVLTDEDLLYQELTGGRIEKLHRLTEKEILFEAANTVRMGKDLLFLVSSSGNQKAAKWLQSVLGEDYTVHTTDDIYRSSHIDSTVLCLRPGTVLLNSTRVNEKNSPKIFDKWNRIMFTDVAAVPQDEMDFQKNVKDKVHAELIGLGFETNLQTMGSPWVGMNVFSLDQDTLMVDSRQTNLIKVLEKAKFTCIPIRMRHHYTQGGGMHCATLDTVRDSKLESYFD